MASCRAEMGNPARSIIGNSKCTGEPAAGPKSRRARLWSRIEAPIALMSGTRGMGAAQGPEGKALQDYPQQGRNPHAEKKARKKLTLKACRRRTAAKAPAI